MKMLVLGGGFGGIVAAHTLRNTLGSEHEVTLMNQSSDFYLRAAFPKLAFESEVTPDDLRLRLDEVLPARGINFRKADVTAIRPEKNMVETSAGAFHYDYLILALGTNLAKEKVPGLVENSSSIWTVEEAQRLGARIKNFTSGSFVTGTALGSPCEGPMWETAVMMDYLARQRGVRDKIEIHHITPKPRPLHLVGPAGVRWGEVAFKKLGIHVYASAEITQVTPQGQITLRDGRELHADVALLVPPYVGHRLIKEAKLGDENGFVVVDPHMRTRTFRNIFAIGDCTYLSVGPKSAHDAMRGGVVAATNIVHEIAGEPADREHRNEVMCVINNGGGKGTYVKSDSPWGGSFSLVMGAHSDTPGISAEEAHFIKTSFGEHFLKTGGNVRYIM